MKNKVQSMPSKALIGGSKFKVQSLENKKTNKLLKKGAGELGIYLEDAETALFLKYLDELKEWNKKINLTAIKGDRDIVIRHFLDSLTLAPFLKTCETLPKSDLVFGTLLDIGSGAGFPGIPLKIILPELKVMLLDSNSRKVSFMKHIIRALGLKDIIAVHGRAEDREVISRLGTFDIVTSRAFSALNEFLYIAKPYTKEDGLVLAIKGPKGIKELEEVKEIVGLRFIKKKAVQLPFSDIATRVFVFKKR